MYPAIIPRNSTYFQILNAIFKYVYGQVVVLSYDLIWGSLVVTTAILMWYLIVLVLSDDKPENVFLHVYLPLILFLVTHIPGVILVEKFRVLIADFNYFGMIIIDTVLSLGVAAFVYWIAVILHPMNALLVLVTQSYAFFYLFLIIDTKTILDFSLSTVVIGAAITFLTTLDPDKTKTQKHIVGMGIFVAVSTIVILLLKNIHVETVAKGQAIARLEAQKAYESLEDKLATALDELELAKSTLRDLHEKLAQDEENARAQAKVKTRRSI